MTPLTPDERDALASWAYILDDQHVTAPIRLTAGRAADDHLNLCETVRGPTGLWEHRPLVSLSAADLLLFRRVFLAALTQETS